MKKLGQFFTNPLVISILGFLCIALLIWFAGPQIKFGADNHAPLAEPMARLLVIMFILVLWLLVSVLRQLQNGRSNKALVNDLQQSNSAAQQDMASDQAADEVAQLGERFQSALDTLNKLKFHNKGRTKALYQLPWYIIVGPPGSGKTTALVNSGLEFPLAAEFGKGALQGVGGTRNCDWWFTNEGVLIDTAGRYTTQDSHKVIDSSAWEGFLSLLKRNRRRRPINGAIVAISLQDLLLQTEEERALHAKTIRNRLDELMEKLEIRFPVYLMFTKTDLVSGFAEFFEDLGREDREQVWGVSLPNAPKGNQSPDFEFLKHELAKLLTRLNERVLWRMHQERDSQRCAAIEGFPLQMENALSLAEDFIKRTFAPNRFQLQPYLRGVYFSSGTQDGTPIDRLMTSISANFGFAREAGASNTGRGRSYFISRLFREVIFPESELVGTNQRYERFIRLSRTAAYAAAAIITGGVLLLWSGSVTRGNMYIKDVQAEVSNFKAAEAKLAPWNTSNNDLLQALNSLYNASSVYDKDAHPMLAGLGLYDDSVDQSANSLYQQKLKTLFEPYLLKTMEQELQRGRPDQDLYNSFRLYMMFKVTDKMDKAALKTWFSQLWDKQIPGENQNKADLNKHLDQLFALELSPVELNQSLVSQTRSLLLSIPVAQRIYRRIKSEPQFSQPVNLLNFIGEPARLAFNLDAGNQADFSIPALFTIQGYKALDLSKNSPLFALVGDDEWVLADRDNAASQLMLEDPEKVSADVKALYLAEYASVWSGILDKLSIKRFGSIQELSQALRTLTDPVYSPLASVLDVTKTNTQLTPPVVQAAADKVTTGVADKALDYLATQVEGTSVDKRFQELHQLVTQSPRGPAPIVATLQQLGSVQTFIQEIALAPDMEQKSFEVAKARYQSNASNAVSMLKAFSKSSPEPVQRWLNSIADESWRLIVQSAHGYVAKEWRARVFQPYSQALAGRYPLNSRSTDELALLDFSSFFKPQGTLDQFEKEFIEPFIDKRGQWSSRSVDGYSFGFSGSAMGQLALGAKIRDVFFKQNPETPSINLELRPYFMNKDDAVFTLDLGDQRLSYNHGPKFWKTINWTGQDDTRRIRLIFEDLHGSQFDRAFSGPWAWFHLMDSAQIEATPQSNIYKITFMHETASNAADGPRKIVFEGRATSINNPFKNELLNTFRCPETI